MSAQENLLERLWWAVPSADDAEAKMVASAMLDDVLKEHAHALAEKIRQPLTQAECIAVQSSTPFREVLVRRIDPEVNR